MGSDVGVGVDFVDFAVVVVVEDVDIVGGEGDAGGDAVEDVLHVDGCGEDSVTRELLVRRRRYRLRRAGRQGRSTWMRIHGEGAGEEELVFQGVVDAVAAVVVEAVAVALAGLRVDGSESVVDEGGTSILSSMSKTGLAPMGR